MKLKQLAIDRSMKPVDLISLLEVEIAPGCDALTELTAEQVASAKALLDKPVQPEAEGLDLGPIKRYLSAQLVAESRNDAIANEVARLVALYETANELPTDPSLAALVKEVFSRTKKHPFQWDGQALSLADQVEVVDGRVILPVIEIPMTPTEPATSPASPEMPLRSAAVPALSAGGD